MKSSASLKWSIIMLIACISAFYARSIQVKEDALDLLPESIVSSDLQLIQQLGMVNRVYLSIGLDTGESKISEDQWQQLRQSVLKVGSQLEKNSLFNTVIYRLPPNFEQSLFTELWQFLPVLLSRDDYPILEEAVSEEGVRERLKKVFQLLNSPAGIGLKERVTRDPLGFSLLIFEKLKQLRGEFAITPRDGVFASADQKNCLIWADSSLPLTDSESAAQIEKAVNEALETGLKTGVSAIVIGTLPHTLANIRTVKGDLQLLLPLATIILVVFIITAFRSMRGLLVVGIPFLAALPAIVLQNLICGKVSALALGFGIVLTGLAVDFSVHIYLGLSREAGKKKEILAKLRRPILLAWFTTTGVFFVLLLSSVPSHRQMAILAIAGITLAVLVSWLLVPTIVQKRVITYPVDEKVKYIRLPGPVLPLVCWLILIAAGILCWPQLQYNGDMRVLDATNEEVQADDLSFHATWRGSVDQALVLAKGSSLDQALEVNDTVFSFFADHPDQHIQSVAPIMPGPVTRARRLARWLDFWQAKAPAVQSRVDTTGQSLGFVPGSFTPFFTSLNSTGSEMNPGALIDGPLYPLLASMIRIPEIITDQDDYLAMTLVPENKATWPLLEKLKNLDERISIVSLGNWRIQAEKLLRQDIVRLSVLAALLVVILVTFFFRNLRMVLATLAPVGSALAGMSLFAFLSGQELNTMHILMGIMVIGLCVDYGIFSVCAHGKGMSRTTGKAVSICAVSSCVGFGVLALASHPALYSLGITVLVGIGVAWPTAIWVTPAILEAGRNK